MSNPHRLPRTVVPARYDLTLAPDLGAAAFSGLLDVELTVTEPTTTIVCNAAELEIDECYVLVRDDEMDALVDVTWTLDPATERLTMALGEPLGAGDAVTVHLEFRGTLNDKLRGFYRSTYTDADGHAHVIATTQMQATDCRRAFPCWDEPDFKAVFGITLVVDEGLLAISNSPEVGRRPAEGSKVAVRFDDTMPLSTYLVAFVVGPLEATAPVDVAGTPMRVVHVPGKADLAGFALDIGTHALQWFQDYYAIPYPGEKIDLVALPDFAAGAMENLGCITFRESLLLVEPGTATQLDEQLVADVTAHELAHMWFGDLVTMRWWNGIWLNEAFATFMEVAACDAFRPVWRRWEAFNLARSSAFEVDGLTTTRPIEFEVVSPSDADGMFDVLTYEKGGAVLRMLEQFLGPPRFRDGIRHYLRTHSYGNTETGDLWDALEHTSGEPVRRIMDTWIWQGGHPLVEARLREGDLVLSQRRFLYAGDDDGTRWAVPVHVRQRHGEAVDDRWVLLDADEVALPLLHADATVVVNAEADGFFRVAYSPELLGRLTGPALATLTTSERYALVDDAWAAVVAGRLDAASYLHLARGFGDEPDLPVWQVLLAGLRWCDRFVDGAARDALRTFVRGLVAPALQRLGWEPRDDEDPLRRELRGLLVRSLAVLGADPHAVERCRALHEEAEADPRAVDPEVAAAALTVVAATGGAAEHDRLVGRFRAEANPQRQLRYLYALADLPGAEEMDKTLAFVLSGEVRTQNAPFVLNRCITHRDHGERAWRVVREHWAEANQRFPNNTIVRMVDGVKTLTQPEQQADVAAFFAEHPIPQAAKTLAQVLERQGVNVALRQRAAADLTAALS